MSETWKPMDLRTWHKTGPHIHDLVVLHLVHKTDPKNERYIVGTWDVAPTSAELMIWGADYAFNVKRLTQRYHVSWIRLPEDTGSLSS